jgi:hypothetical protein
MRPACEIDPVFSIAQQLNFYRAEQTVATKIYPQHQW